MARRRAKTGKHYKSRARSLAAKRAWARRRAAAGESSASARISPMAHLARKVKGIDTRVVHLEEKVGTRRKRLHKLGELENGTRGHEYWATGE